MGNFTITGSVIIVVLTVFLQGSTAEEPEKLVNGYVAIEGEFPFVVSLRYRGQHVCGGTLITGKHVLSAAHCVHERQRDDFTVLSGTIFLNSGGETHNVKYIYSHPKYVHSQTASYVHDIAVIRLFEPIVESSMQRPIALASVQTPGNVRGEIIGWGRTKLENPTSEIQRKTHTKILDNDGCQARMYETIYDSQVCTLEKRGVGVCKGDSGGPLVYKNEIVGIASTAYLCATGVPDVFTRVFYYRKFVEDVIDRFH